MIEYHGLVAYASRGEGQTPAPTSQWPEEPSNLKEVTYESCGPPAPQGKKMLNTDVGPCK